MRTDFAASIDDILIPDTMLPSQYFTGRTQASGEVRLAFAVLEDGIDSLRQLKKRKEADTAIDFFFAPMTGNYCYPFSFAWLCELFGIDMARSREAIAARSLNPRAKGGGKGRPACREYCKQGHMMTAENSQLQRAWRHKVGVGRVWSTYWTCRECHRTRNRQQTRLKRLEAGIAI